MTGTIYISDEYGPFVYAFDQSGKRVNSIDVPDKFLITTPNADGNIEISSNTSGRVANRGMEGLSITPDGTKLYGIMQSPLIQDQGRDGVNNRLLMIDIATGNTQEFVYQLDNNSYGASEILAINDHQFLVDERDGKAGTAAAFQETLFNRYHRRYRCQVIGTTSDDGLPAPGFLPGSPR